MRYAKGHKEETHQHIVKVASQRFREEGIEKVGVAALMEHAGLTVGGFYSHFKSKEDLIQEAVGLAADETFCRIFSEGSDSQAVSLERILARYLSPEHRDHPEAGCVFASLASELKNRPEETRAMVAGKTVGFIRHIADTLPAKAEAEVRMRAAAAIWAVMVGTLQLSRIVTDPALSTQLLQDGIATALRLASEIEPLRAG
ncbi:TetR/AcrR family transcriptional regulator [Enterobacter sp. Cy-643]|uniref:TetR/AcrR family transcriptional regulator n=1 Tax=Enterobacter sp. Cy-643 TaxID=2608346 RepID=UPI00141F9EA2|nr:TetR/AcrR family transcriptional regulator [Enterobacter sp. Cy-643]NIF30749.1 TetR/AcrR family transcriptional regulator [Enterobacter sp. Cy-643]